MSTLLPPKEMERAYLEKDASYDGLFIIAVKTTGIFCRPTCPARKPLPKNVEYYPSPRSALFAGYRPCKRCKPMAQHQQPDWAVELIAEIESDPTQRISEYQLKQRGIDPATVRRYFQKEFQMTFQAYARSRRLTTALSSIRQGAPLDQAVYASGYESHSGFREAFSKILESTPGNSKNQDCILLTWMNSPLGPLVAGANQHGVCMLEFTDRRMLETQFKTLKKLFKVPLVPGSNDHLAQLKEELEAYFQGNLRRFKVKLSFPGTPFQQKVWGELLKIPYGETRSYQDMAQAVGSSKAVRAVGTANGKNRIGIIIPCHRVVNKNGNLGGYGGGLRRKEFLLNLEGASLNTTPR